MKAVCVCGDVHLPYNPKWYWPAKGTPDRPDLDRYFDRRQIFTKFQTVGRGLFSLNSLVLESIENGGKYAFNLSGPFLDQCRWNPEVTASFRELLASGGVEFTGSCRYRSLSALYPDLSWFREEVSQQAALLREFFGKTPPFPQTFVNTELLLSGRGGAVLADMGFKGIIAEGSHNLLNGYDPSYVYENHLPTLLRHINLSEDLELRFSDRSWKGYPLIPEKFADWIGNIEGDVVMIYFNYANLCLHHRKESPIADFVRKLPLELKKRGIEMFTPSEAISRFRPEKLSTLRTEQTIRYGMHNVLGNRAQQLYLRELVRVGEEFKELSGKRDYTDFRQIFGYLQQSDILFSMSSGENIREGYEKAVNYYSILSDFRRAVLEEGT
ncbi:MAG: glycoside hydrolase family 57 protein [Methanosarcinaceae archaeon]|nr:glycoside hydrolase family 57 protein [Methanosarcinaceae archaeon]